MVDKEANIVIGRELRRMRQERGLTQAQVAEELIASQSLVSKTEQGARSLGIYEAFLYARALSQPLETLIGRIGEALEREHAKSSARDTSRPGVPSAGMGTPDARPFAAKAQVTQQAAARPPAVKP